MVIAVASVGPIDGGHDTACPDGAFKKGKQRSVFPRLCQVSSLDHTGFQWLLVWFLKIHQELRPKDYYSSFKNTIPKRNILSAKKRKVSEYFQTAKMNLVPKKSKHEVDKITKDLIEGIDDDEFASNSDC